MEFTETSFNMLQANNPNQIGDHHPSCHRNHHVKVNKKKFLRTFKIIENNRGKYIIIIVNNLSRRLHARRRIDNFNPSENLVIFWNVGLRPLKIIPKKCLQSFWFQFIFSRSIFKVWHVPYVLYFEQYLSFTGPSVTLKVIHFSMLLMQPHSDFSPRSF